MPLSLLSHPPVFTSTPPPSDLVIFPVHHLPRDGDDRVGRGLGGCGRGGRGATESTIPAASFITTLSPSSVASQVKDVTTTILGLGFLSPLLPPLALPCAHTVAAAAGAAAIALDGYAEAARVLAVA